jgi:hypothetical protein
LGAALTQLSNHDLYFRKRQLASPAGVSWTQDGRQQISEMLLSDEEVRCCPWRAPFAALLPRNVWYPRPPNHAYLQFFSSPEKWGPEDELRADKIRREAEERIRKVNAILQQPGGLCGQAMPF